jgi:hypothetical protein
MVGGWDPSAAKVNIPFRMQKWELEVLLIPFREEEVCPHC